MTHRSGAVAGRSMISWSTETEWSTGPENASAKNAFEEGVARRTDHDRERAFCQAFYQKRAKR